MQMYSKHDASRPEPGGTSSISGFLASNAEGGFHADARLWGFGGLHGGLALAAIASRLHDERPTGGMRSISGRFVRAIRGPFQIETAHLREAGGITFSDARIIDGARILATASAVLGGDRAARNPKVAPIAPAVPSWRDCDEFTVPRSFAPIAAATDIRPVDGNLPFNGRGEPRLRAWARLCEDDGPPDAPRLIFLADALAPSYSTVLSRPVRIPSLEISIHLTGAVPESAAPWVLVEALTDCTVDAEWVTETINMWSSDGTHVATSRQLRLIGTPDENRPPVADEKRMSGGGS